MRRFFIFLYGATAVTQLPFVVGAAYALGGDALGWGAAVVVGVATVVLLRGRVALARWDRPISTMQRHLLEEPFFVHWCASLLAFVLAIFLVPAALAFGTEPGAACLASYAGSLPFAVWGVIVRRRWVRVRQLEIPIAGLPEAFDGYRVAQLSDVHLGSHCPPERVRSWVQRVNAMTVDMVALTGDYVTSGVRFHEAIAACLGELRARDGVFAVMGNHDYYGDGEPLMTLLKEQGIVLLRNERIDIARDEDVLALAGVDDIYTRRIDIAAALDGFEAGRPLLMLAHDPKSFPELAERGSSLVLSGHTHWGQVGMPWFAERLNYAQLLTPHAAGLHHQGGATLYVNPGLGTTGPPVRFGSPPEITVFTLRRAALG